MDLDTILVLSLVVLDTILVLSLVVLDITQDLSLVVLDTTPVLLVEGLDTTLVLLLEGLDTTPVLLLEGLDTTQELLLVVLAITLDYPVVDHLVAPHAPGLPAVEDLDITLELSPEDLITTLDMSMGVMDSTQVSMEDLALTQDLMDIS